MLVSNVFIVLNINIFDNSLIIVEHSTFNFEFCENNILYSTFAPRHLNRSSILFYDRGSQNIKIVDRSSMRYRF